MKAQLFLPTFPIMKQSGIYVEKLSKFLFVQTEGSAISLYLFLLPIV